MSGASRTRMFRTMVRTVALGATLVATAGCGAELGVAHATDGYPPDAFIATAEPVYFVGRASYWHGSGCYYRDGSRWSYYRTEPAVLHPHRLQAPPGHCAAAPPRRPPRTAATLTPRVPGTGPRASNLR